MDLLVSFIISAFVFSNLAILVSTLSRKKEAYQQKMDQAYAVMSTMELPLSDQSQIVEYFTKT